MKKNCVECKIEFIATRKDKKYCTIKCANKAAGKRRISRKSKQIKTCTYCNKPYTGQAHKFCSVDCRYQSTLKNTSRKVREKVRERHAKKPKTNCLSCGIELETTVRNYHQLEFCPPCGVLDRKEKKRKYYKNNKERLSSDMKKRHATNMEDPEYKKKRNARNQARRDANPVIANCVICESSFRKINSAKTCSLNCSKKYKIQQESKPEKRLSKILTKQLRRSATGKIASINMRSNLWSYFEFTIYEFKEHFESLFVGQMSWETMHLIHIDHIRPRASFNQEQLADPTSEDFKKCWALNNLQPLWAEDNLRKGDSWDGIINA